MTQLPQALQRQIDEAEALEAQLYPQQTEGEVTPEESTEAVVEEQQAAPEPEAQAPEVEETQPQVQRENTVEYWRDRYNTVNGMLSAQGRQLSDANKQLQALANEVETLKSAKQETPKTEDSKPLVTDKDVETFGSDLIELQERIAKKAVADARAEFTSVIDTQANYIKQLEQQLGNVGQQVTATTQDRFYDGLSKQVADWEQINGESAFINWLHETDPLTGVSRQVYLDDAANRFDLGRVVAIFNTYKQVSGKTQQQQVNQVKKAELERQVAPTKTRGSAPTKQGDQRVWTKQEYEQAFDPRFLKNLSQQEQAQLEAEADRAAAEGRVAW